MSSGRLQRVLLMSVLDVVVIHCSLILASRMRFGPVGTGHWDRLWDDPWLVYIAYLALYLVTAFAMRWGEHERVWTLGRELRYATQTAIAHAVLSMVVIVAFKLEGISRLFLLTFFTLQLAGFILVRLMFRWWMERKAAAGLNAKHVVIVGTGPLAKSIATDILGRPYSGYKIVGYVTTDADGRTSLEGVKWLGTIEQLGDLLRELVVDTVMVTLSFADYGRVMEIVRHCEILGKEVCLLFDPGDAPAGTTRSSTFMGVPTLELGRKPGSLSLTVKRGIDIFGSLLMLILLSPLFLIVSIAIKLESPGPVFFRQRRVGLNGREFIMYKFRSMVDGAEKKLDEIRHLNEMTGPVFKIKNDPRITRVGRFIRKMSIDELPQFINVLKGEMSLVGPRPPLPSEVSEYEEWHYRRLSVKPGITCVWQVSGRNEIGFDEWVRMDLEYIDRWSLWLDLKLLLKTVPAVLRGTGV